MLRKIWAILLLLPALAFADTFEAGKDYELISASQEGVSEKGKAKIVEFFSYGCPWCYKMEEPLENWIKTHQTKITLERVPVVFNKTWDYYAKAYYIAQTLSMLDKMTPVLFKAIQQDHQTLNTNESMVALFVSQGADKAVVSSAFSQSLTIDTMVKNGMNLMGKYQINSVPAFVVNGHYKVDLQRAGNPQRLLQILDYLIALDNKP